MASSEALIGQTISHYRIIEKLAGAHRRIPFTVGSQRKVIGHSAGSTPGIALTWGESIAVRFATLTSSVRALI